MPEAFAYQYAHDVMHRHPGGDPGNKLHVFPTVEHRDSWVTASMVGTMSSGGRTSVEHRHPGLEVVEHVTHDYDVEEYRDEDRSHGGVTESTCRHCGRFEERCLCGELFTKRAGDGTCDDFCLVCDKLADLNESDECAYCAEYEAS